VLLHPRYLSAGNERVAQISSNAYYDWLLDHVFMLVPAQAYVAEFLTTFKGFPPSQTSASFIKKQGQKKLLWANHFC